MAKHFKFDVIIGNPPYQDTTLGDNDTFAPPIYNKFMDAAYTVADKVELIHPARFLFNAGSTPKSWNNKMLQDTHFKVLLYENDCRKMFSNTDIKGGIAISYRDANSNFGAIDIFTSPKELNEILHKVKNFKNFKSMTDIVITRTAYRLTDKMHEEHPEAIGQLSKGHAYDMSSNIFDRLPQIFYENIPNDSYDYIQMLGRKNNERVIKFIRKDYVRTTINTDKYKVVMPRASGTGDFGEKLGAMIIGNPNEGTTETFITIGKFATEKEAFSATKYICTKFCRTMLGVLKTTQDITPEKWQYVPMQDFTSNSDIDWNKSISEIDQQLYKKYGLSQEEIEFIEKNVKEME